MHGCTPAENLFIYKQYFKTLWKGQLSYLQILFLLPLIVKTAGHPHLARDIYGVDLFPRPLLLVTPQIQKPAFGILPDVPNPPSPWRCDWEEVSLHLPPSALLRNLGFEQKLALSPPLLLWRYIYDLYSV